MAGSGKLLADLVHRGTVLTLLAGTAYGTFFVTSCVMELRKAGQEAAKKPELEAGGQPKQ